MVAILNFEKNDKHFDIKEQTYFVIIPDTCVVLILLIYLWSLNQKIVIMKICQFSLPYSSHLEFHNNDIFFVYFENKNCLLLYMYMFCSQLYNLSRSIWQFQLNHCDYHTDFSQFMAAILNLEEIDTNFDTKVRTKNAYRYIRHMFCSYTCNLSMII